MGLYVYILKCSDKSYYVGITNDPEARVIIHNQGVNKAAFTYTRRPVVLTWCNFFHSNLEAIAWEKKLKGWSRKKKEALINGDFDLLHELAKCQNESHSDNLRKSASTPLSITRDGNEECASTPLSVTRV